MIDMRVEVIAISIAALLSIGAFGGIVALLLGIVAVVFVLTAAVGWCPLYAGFGISTHRPTHGVV